MNASVSERRIRNNRMRRSRELRHRFLTCIFTFVLAVGFSFLFFGFRTKAQGNDEDILYKYYKSVVVEAGDTLWDYADEYGTKEYYDSHQDYINEVMQMNGLYDDQITEGQHIVLPYYSPEFM